MSLTVEVISKEIVKPETPTPDQLKIYNLSFIDQYVPPMFVPILLFYSASLNGSGNREDLELLKRSLSQTLVHFYPMAGRLKHNIIVDCNDEGIEFIVAKVKGKMCEFFKKPEEQLSKMLQSEVVSRNIVKDAQVIVQVNLFECGVTAICLCISHKIADASSIVTFIRCWADISFVLSTGGATAITTTNQKLHPTFDSASLFPPSEQLVSASGVAPTLPDVYPSGKSKTGNKIVSRRFIFDAVKISNVREKLLALMDDIYKCRRPTRVEVVSALIWKSIMKSAAPGSLSLVNHALNLRKRIDPPLQDVSFGNLVTSAKVIVAMESTQTIVHELNEFVGQLREALRKLKGDAGFIEKSLRGYASSSKKNDDEMQVLWMTSWCNFGLYEIDFGWGKPIWVTTDATLFAYKNQFVMNDTCSGGGVEVWVNLVEEDMANFELNLSELLECI